MSKNNNGASTWPLLRGHDFSDPAEDSAGFSSKEKLSKDWLIAYAESLTQKRRAIAPIDEPCFE